MILASCIPSSVFEVGKQDVCISVLKSYRLQKVSLDKSGGFIQSCKLCGHSENVLNLLLCDRCEEAFHISCCNPKPKPRVVLPIDEWFCHRCSQITSSTKSPTISQGIGPCQFEFGPVLAPIAAMLKYPEPFTSTVRIGEAYQAQVPDWAPLTEVKTDNRDCSDCADSQLGSHSASRKRENKSFHHNMVGGKALQITILIHSYAKHTNKKKGIDGLAFVENY